MRFLNRSAGRLSRHRRGPLAGVAVLLLGLLLTGGVYTALAPAQAEEQRSSTADVEAGRALFLVGCAFCHGQNGEGISTDREGQQMGPSLVGVGAAAVDFQVGTGRMPMAHPGSQAPRKRAVYNDEEIAQLAAFVASLGPGPAIPNPEDYSIDGLSDEEREKAIVNGGQNFPSTRAAPPHFHGKSGAMPRGGVAPNITPGEPRHIYEALLTGPQTMPNFSNGNLTPEEKRDVIAYIGSLNDAPEIGGFTLGGLGPVSEGMFAWIGGIGILIGAAVWIASHTTRSKKNKAEA